MSEVAACKSAVLRQLSKSLLLLVRWTTYQPTHAIRPAITAASAAAPRVIQGDAALTMTCEA
ncbi:hypothetical protein A3852_22205 [Rhodococcus qingshengii]|nr:hypothetical protein A3852_22205 [Rhodococcus qingshengii]